MLLDIEDSQLVLVDYQERLMPALLDGPAALANAVRLAQLAALLRVPTFATEQNPSKLGGNVPELAAALQQAGARVLSKMQFSAVEEGLGEWLRPPTKPVQGNARAHFIIKRLGGGDIGGGLAKGQGPRLGDTAFARPRPACHQNNHPCPLWI